MAALDARAEEVRLASTRMAGELAEVVERAQVDNAAAYRPFNRKLRSEHMQVLETAWAPKLSLSLTRPGLAYMAARASEVERELDGRFDASIEDMLLRTLVARATKGASIDVLEIGTLFGAGAAIMFDATKDRFAKAHFTLLDPLDDYREERGIDPVTGLPVSERVVRRNLMRVGVGQDQFRLIKRLSTNADAISEASERLYDVLVIDSDHSYAGVKSDFDNYARLVRLGGHIVFGGYGSENSPDVQAFADAELPAARFVTPVGAAWETAVYRVVQPPQGPPARRRPPSAKAVRARSPTPKKTAPKRKR
jgi:predicted O-methyltransferase YrrM